MRLLFNSLLALLLVPNCGTAAAHGTCDDALQNDPKYIFHGDYKVPRRNPRAAGFDKLDTDFDAFLDGLTKLVMQKGKRGDRRLKIALAGTLALETQVVSKLVIETVEKVTRLLPDIGTEWTVEIIAYSIKLEYLLKNESTVHAAKPNGIRYRFELIDLTDPMQLRILTREKPDAVFMVSSLYINSLFSNQKFYRAIEADHGVIGKQSIDETMRYFITVREQIFAALPPGGLFAIEAAIRGHGLPPGRFNLLPKTIPEIAESGVYQRPFEPGR